MGFFRYFLAIVVIFSHIPFPQANTKIFYGNGGLAVLAFYVISGFYMSLIVDKYQLGAMRFTQIKNFYLSRSLRIYPVYYICALLTVLLYIFHIRYSFTTLPWTALQMLPHLEDKIIYVFTNVFIFGLDTMRLYVYDPLTKMFMYFPNSAGDTTHIIGPVFSIEGQAWSLSMELCFYLLVPFILTKNRYLILVICLLSWLLRLCLMLTGFDHPPTQAGNMTIAFFPTGLGVFLLGAVAHRFITPRLQSFSNKNIALMATGCLSLILIYSLVLYDLIDYFYFKFYLFILITALCTPVLFAQFNKSKIDQYIGELSYPVYMTHLFCIGIVMKITHGQYTNYLIPAVIIVSSCVSAILIHCVVKPIDAYRHNKFKASSIQDPLPDIGGALPEGAR